MGLNLSANELILPSPNAAWDRMMSLRCAVFTLTHVQEAGVGKCNFKVSMPLTQAGERPQVPGPGAGGARAPLPRVERGQ